MTEEQFLILKTEFIQGVKEHIVENGTIYPHLSVLGEVRNPKTEDDNKPVIINIPIPEDVMDDEDEKRNFTKLIFPKIAKDVKKRFIPKALVWTAIDYETINPIEKEVIVISIETQDNKEIIAYDILRRGKSINSEGSLVDNVDFEIAKDFQNFNDFMNLFDKLKD